MKQESGFTLVELMIVIGVAAVLMAIAIPGILGWMPDYRLKGAANDLFSNLQWTKLNAVKANKDWAVVFDTVPTSPTAFYLCPPETRTSRAPRGRGQRHTWTRSHRA